MAAVFAGAGSVTAMAETADTAAAETQAESQAAKPAPTEFAHITSCEVTGGNQFKLSHKSYSFIISSSNVLMVNLLFSSIA